MEVDGMRTSLPEIRQDGEPDRARRSSRTLSTVLKGDQLNIPAQPNPPIRLSLSQRVCKHHLARSCATKCNVSLMPELQVLALCRFSYPTFRGSGFSNRE